eukprot:COSAG02_NODE_5612_length_4188_cov_45.782098_3_plen_68_part_00
MTVRRARRRGWTLRRAAAWYRPEGSAGKRLHASNGAGELITDVVGVRVQYHSTRARKLGKSAEVKTD